MLETREATPWTNLPKGWTQESVEKFWSSLTSSAPKHKVTKCIEKMKDSGMDNPGAFCASLADKMTPGWREEAAKERKKKKAAKETPMPEPRTAKVKSKRESMRMMNDLEKKHGKTRAYYQAVIKLVEDGVIAPSAVVGGGYKNGKAVALKWLKDQMKKNASQENPMSDHALIARLEKLARDDEGLRPALMPILREAIKKSAHGPVSMRRPDAMYYFIDPVKNNSKFYEMRIVPAGRETPAKRSTGDPSTANFVLERRWGRLTDTGATGRVDSYNEYWADNRMAERSMIGHGRKRTGKGYQDVTRSQEYPIGLGSADFSWGGQAACAVIPELGTLKDAMGKALSAVLIAERQIRPIAKADSSMARKLNGMLEGVEEDLAQVVSYLDDQMAYCQ